MANNRIYLYCRYCRIDDTVNAERPDHAFLAKTYLDGYYTNSECVDGSYARRLDEWFELHNHGLEYNICLEYEHPEEEMEIIRAQVKEFLGEQ